MQMRPLSVKLGRKAGKAKIGVDVGKLVKNLQKIGKRVFTVENQKETPYYWVLPAFFDEFR